MARLARGIVAALLLVTAAAVPAPAATGSATEPLGGQRLARTGVVVADPVPGVPDPPLVDAAAYLLADAGSGDVLAGLNAHVPRPPASVIKLLTALALLPRTDVQVPYVATDADASVTGSRVGLVPGHAYTVNDLAYGLLLASGNDAAHALAEAAGGQQQALAAMNDEAERLGAWRTRALTPHGLDEPGQVSTPYDLALVARAALADPVVSALAATPAYVFPGPSGPYQIQNQNRLLGRLPGAVGLKTGFTSGAGHTLVAAAQRDGRTLVAVVLGSEGRAEDAAGPLLEWGFAAGAGAGPVSRLLTPTEVAEERRHRERAAAETARDSADGTAALPAPVVEAVDEVLASREWGRTAGPVIWAVAVTTVLVAGAILVRLTRRARDRSRDGDVQR